MLSSTLFDDWALEKMTLSQRNDLLEIMEDRLLHNSHKIKLKGESVRKAMSNIKNTEYPE